MAKTKTKKQTVEIRVDQDRMQDEVTIDNFIAMQEGDLRAIRDTLGIFVVNGSGGWLPADEGVKIVGQMTVNQLLEAAREFMEAAEITVVPKGSKGD